MGSSLNDEHIVLQRKSINKHGIHMHVKCLYLQYSFVYSICQKFVGRLKANGMQTIWSGYQLQVRQF